MKLLILALFVSYSSFAQDRYILPPDIIEARDKVLASKAKLDRDILNTYFRLCNQRKINEAEHIEMLAYREITGLDCWQLIFRQ